MILKFLQWNVLYKENIDKIASLINKVKPDIVNLQELSKELPYNNGIDTAKYIADKLNFEYIFHEAMYFSKENIAGNGIFSKFPMTKTFHSYTMVPRVAAGIVGRYGSVYVESKIDVKGKRITVGTDHLLYVSRFRITREKIAEANAFIDIIKKKRNNYIVSGDFNASPNTALIRKISQKLNFVGPDYLQKTAFSRPTIDPAGWKMGFDWRLDYVFATPDVKVKSAKIIKTSYSDHLPILVEFEM